MGFLFATLFDLPSVLFNGLAKLLEDRICLPWPLSDVCVGDLLALIFRGIGKGASAINILGKMATKLLTPTCIVLDSGFCDDNVNKVDFYPGCGYFLFNLFPLSSATDVVERGDIAWEKTQEAQQEKYNGKSGDEVRTASNHTGKLHNCYENALAQENEATSFNFNNDWINGTLYAPLWYRKITPKKRFLFGLFTRKAKDEWCTSKQYFASLRYIQHCAVERDGSKTITNFDGDTTDLKFIRNSECVDGDCHERHVALPGLGGVIHSKKTMLGQDVYYYKPVEWSANLPSNELYTGKKKGELKLLFATDIVLLGSLDSCDMNGVPQFFKNLESTTYNMPGDILFTDYEFHYVIDPETGNATSNYNTQDYTVHSEMAGCDWGNPNEFNKKDGGLFYSIGCTNGETELKAKSCVNLSRICEYGVSLDVTKQIPIINNENIGNWEHASESEIEQAEDGTYYKRLITDGFISWDELYNLDERSMFATMNGNQLKTKINTNNGLKEYDFRYLYPENFDGSLAERMKRQTQNYSPEINYKFNYLLEKASRDYYLFRMGNKPYYYDSNNAFPRYENSFYFYFGLNEGKTAIEKFNSKYFAECDNEKGVYNNFNIYKKSSSWCSSLNETYDGFIALDLEKIATPYSIVITGDNTFTLDGITDEKIIFYNKSYSAPEGFEDYAHNKFEEFKDEKTFIPNGSYYITITDANEEEYHYELDMGYNFLMYSNNVQSFKKNHEDLLRSLGTNNAIMNDNTKLVYSNPEKIEREIGGVITVYGVHDNDGDIEQYKIEVREIVDFDKTDIQKTITKEGETWYDEEGNLCKVTSIDKNGTIHYTKNGEGNYKIVGRNTIEDYEGMKKELVVPEWYDKNAVKHNLTEKDKNGKYVYEEGAQQADFNPLINKLEKDEIWYDTDGNFCKVTSIDTDGTIHYTKNGEEKDEKGNPYKIVGRDTVVDYRVWTLELNLPTYYDKNGEKQYYVYQPNKETSAVDFEFTDRLKKLTDVGDTWYDADGNFCKVTKIIDGTIHYTKNGKEKDEKDKPYTIVGRNTVVDYRVWTLEVTPPTWYDLDGNFCEVTSIDTNDTNGTIHYTKNGKGDYTISGRNTVTEVTFNSSLENTPYLEHLYNLNKGNEYVKKYDLEDSDGVEYGISYKVISPYALTISEYDKLTPLGKFDYDVYDYINKQDSSKVIDVETYNQLEGGYSQKSYDVYQYINKQDSSIITKAEWEDLSEEQRDNYKPHTYVNKYDTTIITSEDWAKLPTEYCKEDYDVHQYINKHDEKDIISSEEYNGLSDGYGKNDYKTEITYCKIENKTEHITKEEYENDKSIQSLYQPSHVLEEKEEGIKILIENGYDKTLKEEDYKNIIVNYNAFGILLNSTKKTEIEFYTKKSKAKKCNYDSTDKRWEYDELHIEGNYIIDYQDLGLEKNKDEVYYDYEGNQQTVKEETETVLDFTPLVRVLSFDTWLDEDGALCEFTSITPQGEKILTSEQWDTLSTDEKTLYEEVYVNKTDSSIIISKEEWETLDTEEQANYAKMYCSKAIIHYTKNGESGYTIVGRDTVINYNQPIWTKITRSDDNYSWVDKNGVTQYASAKTLVVDYSWLLKTIAQEEIVWYDKEGNAYKVTEIEGSTIHYTKNGEKKDEYIKELGDIVVDFNHDSFILILDDIDDAWYDEDGNFCEFTSITPQGEKILTFEQWNSLSNNEKTLYVEAYVNKQVSSDVINVNTYNQLHGGYSQKSYVEVYVKNDGTEILTKEQWEALDPVDQDNYEKKYKNKYDVTIITSDDWGKLPIEYCKEDYDEAYVNKTNETDVITKEEWENIEDTVEKDKYAKMYRNKVIVYYTKNGEENDEKGNPYTIVGRDTVVNYYKFMTEPLYLPTWYDVDGNLYKVIKIEGSTIYYTKNGEENDKKGNPYTIVGRDTVVDWSKYIGYEGGEITYDNGVITEIKNALWYDSEKQSFAFGVPDENRTYVITVTQLCNVFDKVIETSNEIKTNVFVSGVIKYKMFINGIDYEIIKNFDGYTGWSYNGTITKNKLTTNVGDLNENNPWFNVDKIYYHNYFEGKDNNKDEYPKINLKDIDRFGIDKDENQQTYRIYATEIDKEDEEVGKKVNETYHGEDGKNKTVKAEDVIATFVNKRNEDDVTTYKVIDFTTKKLTVVGDTWYDADGYFYEVTSIDTDGTIHYTKNGEGNYTIVGRNTVVDYSDWKITLDITTQVTENYFKQYRNKDFSTNFISSETYNRLSDDYGQKSYDVYQYVNKQKPDDIKNVETYNRLSDDYGQKSYDVYQYVNRQNVEDIITKEDWENLETEERAKYKPYTYVNKYDATIITSEVWDVLSPEYCKGDYKPYKYVNKYDATKIISSEDWGKLPKDYCQEDYTEVYLSTWYDKNGTLNYMLPSEEGQERIDFRPLVKTIEKEGETWYDANSVVRVAGSDDIGQEVLDYSKENNNLTQLKKIDFTTADKTWYDKNGIENKADSDKLGLYIDITYMTKGGDTILFNIYNEEYIDKLVIDKLVIKYVNKQDSSRVIDVDTYNQLLDGYGQKSYVEVYVKNDGTEILTKKEWESIEDPDEKDKYAKKYRNKYVESNIITSDDWGDLPKDYCKSDYQLCSAYNFNRNGLHNVRIYLTQKTTYGGLLSDVIDFKGCSDLNTIVLPNIGITTIDNDVFNGCKSLTSIDLPDSITAIGNNAFKGCEKLSSVYIPYQVTKIGESAFNGCKSLTNIVLPKNITTIGDNAFANCEKLQSVRAEMTIKNDSKINIAPNAFDNTNIGLIIYVPMDKDERTYDNSTKYNKEVWGNVKDKVVAIELTVFNYNKVNINPSDLLDEFARNTGNNKIYYNFIDSYVASEYKVFTQVTYFKASDFVNTINKVLSRRREIADRMFNTFYMTQEGETKSFNITSNTDEMPVQPIIAYHEEEIDDVDIDYTLTTPNLTYEQINILKNVNIPTITYKSSPFFGDGTSSDDIIITKSNNIEKKPLSTGIMNVKQKSIPLDSGNKDFPSISLSGGVKAINPSKTNIADLFEFPVIDKIESSSVSAWTKFSNIPSPNPDNIGMINMDGYVYGRHNNGVVERDGKFETRKLGKYEINLSENLNNSAKPYTYAERRVITGLANYSMAQWCILKLRNIVQTDDVTEETLKKIWNMLFNPKNEKGKPLYDKEKLFDVIDTMTVLKQTIDENLEIYIQCDETIDGVKPQWKIDQGEEDYITENLIQFKKFNVAANKDYERQYAFTDTKKANLNIGEINENFNFDNELKLSTEKQSIDVSGQSFLAPENLTRLSFNQGEKEGGHYQLFALSRYKDGFYGKEDMNQYPLYNAAKNGIVYQINDVKKETMLSHEGEITKINDKEKQIQGTFNEEYHSSYFYSMYKFKGSNDDERVWRDSESTNGLYNAKRNFNCYDLATSTGWNWKDGRLGNILGVPDAYFLDTNYIRHVYCVYVKGNMKMLSPLYEFAPTQLVGTWGQLESYDGKEVKSVIGIKVNDFARVYFKHYDYTLGGPFNIKRKYKHRFYGWLSYTIPEGTIKYKDEDYYYTIVDDKLKDEDNYSYEFQNNMGIENMYNNFHKDHVIAKDITDLRHLTWTNGNKLDENNFILIEWKVPESDSFRFISEQKDTETEDFVEKITVEKVYMKNDEETLTRLPKNNGQYKDDDEWTIQYKEKTEEGKEVDVTKPYKTSDLLNGGIKFDKPYIITKNIIK